MNQSAKEHSRQQGTLLRKLIVIRSINQKCFINTKSEKEEATNGWARAPSRFISNDGLNWNLLTRSFK